ncbi:cysteine-rich CWC family protein [Pseudomonadota bacterium]|uniref:cysteine-rich CWC family protein n=1 Tax=Shewanella sp. 10N.286.48.B5 TaxID=1880834 RepID=UPI000C8330D1|nr:cysteine-rich CWC family protein [Shewanella sp. 10N.286.48.B5]
MKDVEIYSPNQANEPLVSEAQDAIFEPLACPVCQQVNQCAVSAGKPIEDCWCLSASVKAVISDKLRTELKGKACVCQSCYQKLSQ